MWDALKKLFGADEESKARRQVALDEERREREQRVQAGKEALERTIKANSDSPQA
jgi:hypothetical protein